MKYAFMILAAVFFITGCASNKEDGTYKAGEHDRNEKQRVSNNLRGGGGGFGK